MIFEVTEETLSEVFAPFEAYSRSFTSSSILDPRISIATLDDSKVIMEASIHSLGNKVFVQLTFRARVEEEGYCNVSFPDLCEMLRASRPEATTYRFMAAEKLLNVDFGIGFFTLSSPSESRGNAHLGQRLLHRDEDSKFLVPELPAIAGSDLRDAWVRVSPCLDLKGDVSDKTKELAHKVALRVQDESLYLQATDGSRLASHRLCDVSGASDALHVVDANVFRDFFECFNGDGDVKLKYSGQVVLSSDTFTLSGRYLSNEDSSYPNFDRILSEEANNDVLVALTARDLFCASNLAHNSEKHRTKPWCRLQLRKLDGTSRLENTFPQIESQGVVGLLRISTRDSGFEVPIATSDNFTECEVAVNPRFLRDAVKALDSDGVVLQIAPNKPGRAVKVYAVDGDRTDIAIMPVYLED